jgi:diacylglycerol kinase family enzyme
MLAIVAPESSTMLTVLVNRAGGAAAAAGAELPDMIAAAFARAGAEVMVRLLDADGMAEAARAASGAGRVVIAGGDGTVACVAQALKGADVELALLPLGTLNHLARDAGIPSDLDAAARLAVEGKAGAIDVAEVNGIRFVNNASIGLYPDMVRRRDGTRESRGWPKWLATIPAAWEALARLPHHRLRIDMGEGEQPLVTPLLFVGNNRYDLAPGKVGSRASLKDGKLSIFAVARRGRGALIWFALRTLAGRTNRDTDYVAIGEGATLTVHAEGGRIEIALDGEVRRLDSPLRFSVDRGGLRLVMPPPDAGS